MEANANENIIRKIQKLFSLAQSPNQAEAELAMARAQELLATHNLEAAMVMATNVAGGTVEAAPEKREKVRINRSAQYNWQRELWKTIAEANFCWHSVVEVFEGKRGTKKTTSKVRVKRHLILGRESNVMAVRLMGEYLEDTMERILPFPNHERLSRAAISWKAGCAERLGERIQEQADARKSESDAARPEGDSTALVLRDVYQSEFAANYDVRYGEGAHARKLITDAKWEAERPERERKAREEREQKEREWLEYLQTESPADKKAREKEEAKQARANEAYWARQDRKWDTERRNDYLKTDHEAKRAGAKAANGIGLSAQVSDARITRKDRQVS